MLLKQLKTKKKDIELILNDEKRQMINIGDIIEFLHIDTNEVIKVEVINLYKYSTFEELFSKFEHKRFGLKDNDDASIMNNFYSREDQEKYGTLGIEIKLI